MKNSIPVRKLAEVSSPLAEFRVLDISEIVKTSPLHQQLHRHDFYFMMIVAKGAGQHSIDFNTFQVQPGTIYFMRPGQVHELQLSQGSEGFILEFSGHLLPKDPENSQSIINSITWNNAFSLNADLVQTILQSAQKIYSESLSDQYAKDTVIRLHLNLILIELHRHNASQSVPPQERSDPFTQRQLFTLQGLLEENIKNKKRVSEYAELMNLTPYQLNHITKSILNKSVSTLINEQILLEAKRLLTCTPNQVNQIAFELGFEDISYFTRFFKKHSGSSPIVFRQNFK